MNGRIVKVEPYWYNEKDCLGAGSFGEVYKGHNEQDANMLLAIKRIKKEKLPQKIINQEIQILQELSAPDVQHVNFVTLLDCVQDESHVYLVMEYCNGGDLHDYLKAKRKLDEASIKLFLRQIASALKILHDHNVVHRDLKPANILLSHNGSREPSQITFKIADFGMGRFLEDGVSAQTFVGTPVFMAPEIFVPDAKYDYKADLWSVGAIVYQCSTGTLYSAFQNEPIRFPTNIDPYLKDLLTKLLCKEPSKRISFNDFYNHKFIGMEHIDREQKQHAERQPKQQIQIQIVREQKQHIDRQPKQQIQIQIDREQRQQMDRQPKQQIQIDRQPKQQIQIQRDKEQKQQLDRQPKQPIDRQPMQQQDRQPKQQIDRQPKQPIDRQPMQQQDRQPMQQQDRQPKQQLDRQPKQEAKTLQAPAPAPVRSVSRSSSKDEGSSGVLMWFRRVFSIKRKTLRAETTSSSSPSSSSSSLTLPRSKTMTLEHREVFGIAHLETRFYVLCRSPNLLVQYSDQSPFIKIKEIDIGGHVRLPQDLAASAVSNCLYVVDAATATAAAADDGCVWKVELGYPIRTTRWIADVSEPHTVSVNGRTGRVTTFGNRSRSLRVHGPKGDAAAAAAAVDVALPSEIEAPRHAVEASSGNFFVVCENPSRRHAGGGGGGVVCEVSVKGQILSRYEKLDCPVYLALDNDGDSVYVADNDGGRVQQLRGAGLKLQRTIPSDEDGGGRSGHGDDEELLERPFRLCFSSSSKGQRRLLVEHRNNNLTIFNLS